jgi:hypothetical protein
MIKINQPHIRINRGVLGKTRRFLVLAKDDTLNDLVGNFHVGSGKKGVKKGFELN